MKQAYVTLLSSEDYLDAVLVLAQCLKDVRSKYPLLVIIPNSIVSERTVLPLRRMGCQIYSTEDLHYSKVTEEKWVDHPVLNTASKMAMFNMKEWDRLVYIDADVLVVANIDDLFDYPDGSMILPEGELMGITGLLVFSPKFHFASIYYMALLNSEAAGFDGDIIGSLWFHVRESKAHQIPLEYFRDYSVNPFQIQPTDKIIHFGNYPKPWLSQNDNKYASLYGIAKLYKEYLYAIQRVK